MDILKIQTTDSINDIIGYNNNEGTAKPKG